GPSLPPTPTLRWFAEALRAGGSSGLRARARTVTATELRERSAEMEDWSPDRILVWAAQAGSRVAFGTGFGAEGCVLVHLIASSRLPVDIFTLHTGVLFPETY